MRGLSLLLVIAVICLSATIVVDGALVKNSPKRVTLKQPYTPSSVNCPVAGDSITVSSQTSTLTFNNGQSLYFCCDDCLNTFVEEPSKFMLDTPLSVDPSINGEIVYCIMSGNPIKISPDTARISFTNGQTLYFCCEDCASSFRENPNMYIKQN